MRAPVVMSSLVIISLFMAGCGDAAEPSVATAQTAEAAAPAAGAPPSALPSAAASAGQSDMDKAIAYARCMTENGSPVPDPVVGESLLTGATIRAGEGSDVYLNRRSAFLKCRQLLPTTWPIRVDPAEHARGAEYRKCMKERGQPVYEPGADGMVDYPTNLSEQSTPEYEAAVSACRRYWDDAANGQPENQ